MYFVIMSNQLFKKGYAWLFYQCVVENCVTIWLFYVTKDGKQQTITIVHKYAAYHDMTYIYTVHIRCTFYKQYKTVFSTLHSNTCIVSNLNTWPCFYCIHLSIVLLNVSLTLSTKQFLCTCKNDIMHWCFKAVKKGKNYIS